MGANAASDQRSPSGAGSDPGSASCARSMDDASQFRVGEGEPDSRTGSSGQNGSAGPAGTTRTAGELRDPAAAAGLSGGSC